MFKMVSRVAVATVLCAGAITIAGNTLTNRDCYEFVGATEPNSGCQDPLGDCFWKTDTSDCHNCDGNSPATNSCVFRPAAQCFPAGRFTCGAKFPGQCKTNINGSRFCDTGPMPVSDGVCAFDGDCKFP